MTENINTNNESLHRLYNLNRFSSFNNRFNKFRRKPSIVQLVIAALYLGALFASIDAFPQQSTFGNHHNPNPFKKYSIANGTSATSTSSIISKSSLNSNSSNSNSSIETNPSSHSVQTQQQHQQQQQQQQQPKPIPITVLSGFLGSGKTTLLQHLLHNNQGLKIAVIVNDVASVNIDNKLLAVSGNYPRSGSGDDNEGKAASIVQLSNGCACCSLSGELLSSVSELVTLSDLNAHSIHDDDDDDENGGGFDHIVIEASGVSEPRAIRSNFQDAVYYGMPLMERVRLDTMVTVLDCSTFLDYMDSGRRLSPREVPELFGDSNAIKDGNENGLEDGVVDGIDQFMSTIATQDDDDYDGTGASASTPDYAEEHSASGVADLLVEQTEVADVVLINKIDIPSSESSSSSSSSKLDRIESIVRAFNPRAKTYKTKFGIVDRLENVLAAADGMGVVDAGVVDDHRDAVEAASALTQSHGTTDLRSNNDSMDDSHHLQHDHSHDHHSHDHHSHDHHSHDHHSHDEESTTTHSHSSSPSSSSCTDPNCTDPTHSHSHSHSHASHDSQSFNGIGTFVYRERRPFHPKRLLRVLHMLPVKRGLPQSSTAANKGGEDTSIGEEEQAIRIDAFKRIIRSKGFTWLADSHLAAMYWSHAGSSFEMQCLGRWWATLPREQWPEEALEAILSDFDCVDHNEQNLSLSSSSPSSPIQSVGDRRQEIVLIGPGLSNPTIQGVICKALDECLLTDDEWALYSKNCGDEQSLRETFVNSLPSRIIAY